MTEFEKMRREEFYDFTSEECLASYYRAKHICAKLQTMTTEDEDYRKTIEDLIPGIPESSTVAPPFHCDHGHGIKLGENVFINYNGTMLDGGIITIGAAKTSTYYALAPFIGALLSILLLGEPITMIFIIASILMAAGCWIAAK